MRPPRPIESVLDTRVGTPTVELRRLCAGQPLRLFAKCEHLTPSQSAKDRPALELILEAERSGRLGPGGLVIEASTGSFAIALAQVCAARGHRLLAVLPESMSLERRETLKLLGAQVELTPAARHIDGALERLAALRREHPEAFFPSQFQSEAMVESYRRSLGEELIAHARAGELRIDAFVCAVGTAALLVGAGRAIRDAFPSAKLVAVEPAESPALSDGQRGARPHQLHGAAATGVPPLYDPALVSQVVPVSSADAWAMQRRLAREEGLLVGATAGANVHAALRLGLSAEAHVWTVLPDTGERYFSVAPEAA